MQLFLLLLAHRNQFTRSLFFRRISLPELLWPLTPWHESRAVEYRNISSAEILVSISQKYGARLVDYESFHQFLLLSV